MSIESIIESIENFSDPFEQDVKFFAAAALTGVLANQGLLTGLTIRDQNLDEYAHEVGVAMATVHQKFTIARQNKKASQSKL